MGGKCNIPLISRWKTDDDFGTSRDGACRLWSGEDQLRNVAEDVFRDPRFRRPTDKVRTLAIISSAIFMTMKNRKQLAEKYVQHSRRQKGINGYPDSEKKRHSGKLRVIIRDYYFKTGGTLLLSRLEKDLDWRPDRFRDYINNVSFHIKCKTMIKKLFPSSCQICYWRLAGESG